MPKYKIDLHMHSLISDGNTSPCEVVDTAHDTGLEKIVFADHNSLHDNFELLKEYAKGKNIEIPFAATEVSALYIKNDRPFIKFHLLVYGDNDVLHTKRFVDLIAGFDKDANEFTMREIERINNSGEIFLSEEEMFYLDRDIAPTWKKTRYAEGYPIKFIAKKLNISAEEVEERYGMNGIREENIKRYPIDVRDVMKMTEELGLVTSIAHAKWVDAYYPEEEKLINDGVMMDMIEDLRQMGLDGIEIAHQINDNKAQAMLRDYAVSNGMICTGGSDFHGDMTGYGSHIGEYGVTEEDFEKLKECINQKRKSASV